jgi:hypothetical protein
MKTAHAQALKNKHQSSGLMDYRIVFAPEAQAQRDHIRPGLRIKHYKKSAIIAFAVSDLATSVGNAS